MTGAVHCTKPDLWRVGFWQVSTVGEALPYVRRKVQPSKTSRVTVGTAALAVIAVIAAIVIGVFFQRQQATMQQAAAEVATYTPAPIPTQASNAPGPPTIESAMKLIAETGRPFTIAVLGDSTGSDSASWVSLVGERLGAQHDRTVIMHPWNEGLKPPGYGGPVELSAGSGAPVAIYNASAPSRNARYSQDNLGRMIPSAAPDIIFINHGHNQGPNTLAEQVGALVKELRSTYPQAAIVPILQNPEVKGSPHAAVQDRNLDSLRWFVTNRNLPSIDVEKAYLESGDFAALYKDSVHPEGAAGYAIWADTVLAALGN